MGLDHTETVPNPNNAAPITTVLLDLDGVIRHFDPDHVASVETAAGLEPGSLEAAAFSEGLIELLITGRISRADWTREVGAAVGNLDAATNWLDVKGDIDAAMIELIDELRSGRITVAILTNGTDTIPAELDELGVTPHVDAIFNTADSERKMSGVIELGMTVHPFVGVADLRRRLRELGLLTTP